MIQTAIISISDLTGLRTIIKGISQDNEDFIFYTGTQFESVPVQYDTDKSVKKYKQTHSFVATIFKKDPEQFDNVIGEKVENLLALLMTNPQITINSVENLSNEETREYTGNALDINFDFFEIT